MYSAVIEQNPNENRADDVREDVLLAECAKEYCEQDYQDSNSQQSEIDSPAVEESDNEYGNQVVGDGQCSKEDLQRHRHPIAESREDADRKGNIRCGRNSPSPCRHRAVIDKGVEQCRCDDTSDRCNHRQNRLLDRAQFTGGNLTLDFESDGKEENDHQNVVDELLYRQVLRKQDVDRAVLAEDVQLERGLKDVVIPF